MAKTSSRRARQRRAVAILMITAFVSALLTTVVQVVHVATAGAATYDSIVSADSPVGYWRLGDAVLRDAAVHAGR